MLKVKVILGSTRDGRHGEKVGKYIHELAKNEANWEVEYLDLKEWNLPLYNEPTPPSVRETFTNELAKHWSDTISEADAYVIITPEYNHGYPAALKNALDWLFKEWHKKAVAFVSYGAVMGGSRAIEQLRQVVPELHMASVRAQVSIPLVWQAFGEDGKSLDESVEGRAKTMFEELTWWGEALKVARNK